MDKEKISQITLDDAIEAFNYRKNAYKKLTVLYSNESNIGKVFEENSLQTLNFEGDLSEFLKHGATFRSRSIAGNHWYNLSLSVEKEEGLSEIEVLRACLKGEESTLMIFNELLAVFLPGNLNATLIEVTEKISASIHRIKLLLSERSES